MYRDKTIIGRRLHARILPNHSTEARIACHVVNGMTCLNMAVTVRVVSARHVTERSGMGLFMRQDGQQPLRFGQIQTEIGGVAKITEVRDLHHIRALIIAISARFQRRQDSSQPHHSQRENSRYVVAYPSHPKT